MRNRKQQRLLENYAQLNQRAEGGGILAARARKRADKLKNKLSAYGIKVDEKDAESAQMSEDLDIANERIESLEAGFANASEMLASAGDTYKMVIAEALKSDPFLTTSTKDDVAKMLTSGDEDDAIDGVSKWINARKDWSERVKAAYPQWVGGTIVSLFNNNKSITKAPNVRLTFALTVLIVLMAGNSNEATISAGLTSAVEFLGKFFSIPGNLLFKRAESTLRTVQATANTGTVELHVKGSVSPALFTAQNQKVTINGVLFVGSIAGIAAEFMIPASSLTGLPTEAESADFDIKYAASYNFLFPVGSDECAGALANVNILKVGNGKTDPTAHVHLIYTINPGDDLTREVRKQELYNLVCSNVPFVPVP